jgi:hypothetical protein
VINNPSSHVAPVGDLVVTPQLLVRWNPVPLVGPTRNNPPKSFVKREAGHQHPDISHGRKPAPSLPELGSRFRETDFLKNIAENSNDPPETRGPVLAGGRRRLWPPATSRPESSETSIGALPGASAHSRPRRRRRSGAGAPSGAGGRDTGGGPSGGASGESKAKEAKRGSCGVPGVGSGGRGRHEHLRLPMDIISIAAWSDLRIRAGTIGFSPPSGHRARGDRAGFREHEGDRTTGRDRTLPTTNTTGESGRLSPTDP